MENSDLKSDRLLELVDNNQSKEEFFTLLKKIDCIISKTELTLEKLNLFREKLNKKLFEFQTYRFQSEIFIIPLMFSCLRKSFYRGRKESELRRLNNFSIETKSNNYNIINSLNNLSYPINDKKGKNSYSIQKKENYCNDNKYYSRGGCLLLESFKIIFGYIIKGNTEDILFCALNYIYGFFEDPISYEIDSKYDTVRIILSYMIKLLNRFFIYSLFNDIIFILINLIRQIISL